MNTQDNRELKVRWLIRLLRWSSRLSLRSAQRLGTLLGTIVWWSRASPARVTQKNIEACFPELDGTTVKELSRRSLQETASTIFECGLVWERAPGEILKMIQSVEGEAYLKQETSRPLLVLGLHLGNWEVLGLYLAQRFAVTTLYAPPNLEGFDSYLRSVRERNGATLVPANQKGVIHLIQALKAGRAVALLPDQEPDRKSGVFAPFFGIEANTMKLASKLVSRTSALPVVAAALRLPQGRGFRIVFQAVSDEMASDNLEHSIRVMNQAIEELVRREPAQYQWEYKRFKYRPDGRPHFYD